MEESETLTVQESAYNHIGEGTTLTVHSYHENQFNGKRILKVSADVDIPNRSAGSRFQLYQMPDDSEWTEIHVGLSREHEKLKFN